MSRLTNLRNMSLVNFETGEIMDALTEFGSMAADVLEEERKRRREMFENMKKKVVEVDLSAEHFIVCIDEKIMELVPHISLTDAGILMKLLAFASKDDSGALRYYVDGTYRAMTIEDIATVIGKSVRTIQRPVTKLVSLGVLAKVGKEGRKDAYGLNPEFHARKGSFQNIYFTKIWLSNLREKWLKLPLETLGFLYKIMPFFNSYSFCLSLRPYEYDVAKSLPFSMNALATMTGMDDKTVRKHINLLSKHGMVLKIAVKGTFIICVNPQVMYRRIVRDGELVQGNTELLFEQGKHISENEGRIEVQRDTSTEFAAKVFLN